MSAIVGNRNTENRTVWEEKESCWVCTCRIGNWQKCATFITINISDTPWTHLWSGRSERESDSRSVFNCTGECSYSGWNILLTNIWRNVLKLCWRQACIFGLLWFLFKIIAFVSASNNNFFVDRQRGQKMRLFGRHGFKNISTSVGKICSEFRSPEAFF